MPITQYEHFLLLIGSVFVPLFGILAADYFLLPGRRYDVPEFYRPQGRYWYREGLNPWGLLIWLLGVLTYQAIARYLPWLGASVPAFLFALIVYFALGKLFVKEDRNELERASR